MRSAISDALAGPWAARGRRRRSWCARWPTARSRSSLAPAQLAGLGPARLDGDQACVSVAFRSAEPRRHHRYHQRRTPQTIHEPLRRAFGPSLFAGRYVYVQRRRRAAAGSSRSWRRTARAGQAAVHRAPRSRLERRTPAWPRQAAASAGCRHALRRVPVVDHPRCPGRLRLSHAVAGSSPSAPSSCLRVKQWGSGRSARGRRRSGRRGGWSRPTAEGTSFALFCSTGSAEGDQLGAVARTEAAGATWCGPVAADPTPSPDGTRLAYTQPAGDHHQRGDGSSPVLPFTRRPATPTRPGRRTACRWLQRERPNDNPRTCCSVSP